jgi:hypothetical protein
MAASGSQTPAVSIRDRCAHSSVQSQERQSSRPLRASLREEAIGEQVHL